MKTTHVFEEGYYLIGNKSVAKSYMFRDMDDCKRFRSKMASSLSPICEILAFGLRMDEFQLLIRLKSRPIIENYYIEKNASNDSDRVIPETTYIFAQLMANVQSGYVKYFNYKYDRDGGLMCRRYYRQLIESESELEHLINVVHSPEILWKRNKIWTFRRNEGGVEFSEKGNETEWSSRICYKKGERREGFEFIKIINISDVRGHFKNLPPKKIVFQNNLQKITNLISFILLKTK